MTKQVETKNHRLFSTLVLTMETVSALIGAVLMVVPKMETAYVCYALSAVSLVLGIILITRYFWTEAYRNLNEYGFSAGVLLVLLGVCSMMQNQALQNSFTTLFGSIVLLSAVVKLQYAMDLKVLEAGKWRPALVLACTLAVCAVIDLFYPFKGQNTHMLFLEIILIGNGICGLILYRFLARQIHRIEVEAEKEKEIAEFKEGEVFEQTEAEEVVSLKEDLEDHIGETDD